MTPRHYLPDDEWMKLASALRVAAADPFDPENEIKMILAANDIVPECIRVDLETQDRREAERLAERSFQVELGQVAIEVQSTGTAGDKRALERVTHILDTNARGINLLARAHAGQRTCATLVIDTRDES